ncbi:tetratricopeptide repeat protein [Pigmentiphaga aceris]|uniref:protein O-GlcNAc transferase n=1 Tax=Pigmentiphaga aceris TaxID=1940612 RepID=A0A5C0AZW9_9BURK|nr:tetratricopeptide repeat protein [Pigmentiphaga aceris]QEI07246.1 tetratricopeptide repeat protein [Pigmentiphaga aceris]
MKKAKAPGKTRGQVSYGQPSAALLATTPTQRRALSELFQRGNALYDEGRYAELEVLGQEWVQRFPQQAAKGWDVIGRARLYLGRLSEAEAALLKGLELDPDNLDIWDCLGVVRNRLGHFSGAHEANMKALAMAPDLPHVLINAAGNLNDSGRYDEALELAERALKHEPLNRLALLVKGNAFVGQDRTDEGIAMYRQVTAIAPDWPDAWTNLGGACNKRGRVDEAIAALQRALELDPNQAISWNNLGLILRDQKRDQEALDCFNNAIDKQPELADPYVNLGTVLQIAGRTLAALEYMEHARKLRPTSPMIYMGIGTCLQDMCRFEEAVVAHCTALELKPDFGAAFSNLLFTLNYHPTLSAEEIFGAYGDYELANALVTPGEWASHANSREPGRRLKIGYVSPDFQSHPVRYFLEPLLAHHGHKDFEIFAYADVAVPDAMTERYRSYMDHWRNVRGLSDHEVADLVRQDGIDILVDLAGHTANNRLKAFSLKPAPIQVSWLGYVSTTGMRSIDYLLSDDALTPPGSEHLLSEIPWRLPSALVYRPPADFPEPTPLPALARGHVTFGSLSRAIRLNDDLLDVWAELMRRVPDSHLVLNSRDFRTPEMQDWMRSRLVSRGVEASRLDIDYTSPAWLPMSNIDIMLDCFPHNSGTTLFESLYFGLPVVSLKHRPTVGRVGASALTAVGHAEWIAEDVDGYLQIACDLAGDLPRLAQIRATLREEMHRSAAMDEPGLAHAVESGYRRMWQAYCEGGQA